MRISDAVKVDAEFRDWRRCRSLEASMQRRLDYHRVKNTTQLTTAHWERYEEVRSILRAGELCRISTLLSSRRMWTAKDLHAWVWEGLPEPGKAQHNALEKRIVETMNAKGRKKRAGTYVFEIASEIAARTAQGWFMIFNTLTVDQENYNAVFSDESTAFQDYVLKLDRMVAATAHGSIRAAHGHDYHSYAAVVERGAKTGRLHIHVLHFVSCLPKGSHDPNLGLRTPYRWELDCLKPLWRYGNTVPKMVRYSPQDAYGRAGYRWPVDSKTHEAYNVGSPIRVAGYMGKYIIKQYLNRKKESYKWRVKKSRLFGRQILEELVSPLSNLTLLETARNVSLQPKLNNGKIPPELLRLTALREYLKRTNHQNDHYTQNRSAWKRITEIAKDAQPLPGLLQCVRASNLKSTSLSLPRNTYSGPVITNSTVASEKAWAELSSSARTLDEKYFARNTGAWGSYAAEDHYLAAPDNDPSLATTHGRRTSTDTGAREQ